MNVMMPGWKIRWTRVRAKARARARSALPVSTVLLGAVLVISPPAAAQPVVGRTQVIDFDRPEAWAMQRTASLTTLTALGSPAARDAGSIELSVELGWNPSLDEDQRRVGFNGTKVEDLNRLAVVPRPRVAIGLGWRTSLELSWIPPVEVDGLEANLLAVAVERPLWESGRWILGARLAGQSGTVTGDITCPADEAAIPPGDPGNAFGCELPSSDEISIVGATLGFTGGYRLGESDRATATFAAYATRMDLEFQVDALTFGVRDRNLLVTDGWTYAITGGVSVALGGPVRLAVEAFYSPLDVDRPVVDGVPGANRVDSGTDGLFNLRALVGCSF